MSDEGSQRFDAIHREVVRLVAEADQQFARVKDEMEFLRAENQNLRTYIAAIEQMNARLQQQLAEANQQIADFESPGADV